MTGKKSTMLRLRRETTTTARHLAPRTTATAVREAYARGAAFTEGNGRHRAQVPTEDDALAGTAVLLAALNRSEVA